MFILGAGRMERPHQANEVAVKKRKAEEQVTVKELAAMLRVSLQAVHKRITNGTLVPSGERNGVIVFDKSSAAAIVAAGKPPAGRPAGSRSSHTAEYPECPSCKAKMTKHGFSLGKQRFRCPQCGKSILAEPHSV